MAKKCRPLEYTDTLADMICTQIAIGKTLNSVCAKTGMPERNTVMNWVLNVPGFGQRYALARRLQAEYFFDLIADAAEQIDTTSALSVQGAKLRIDTLKWAVANVLSVSYTQQDANASGGSGSGAAHHKNGVNEKTSDLEPDDAYQQLLWSDGEP